MSREIQPKELLKIIKRKIRSRLDGLTAEDQDRIWKKFNELRQENRSNTDADEEVDDADHLSGIRENAEEGENSGENMTKIMNMINEAEDLLVKIRSSWKKKKKKRSSQLIQRKKKQEKSVQEEEEKEEEQKTDDKPEEGLTLQQEIGHYLLDIGHYKVGFFFFFLLLPSININ